MEKKFELFFFLSVLVLTVGLVQNWSFVARSGSKFLQRFVSVQASDVTVREIAQRRAAYERA